MLELPAPEPLFDVVTAFGVLERIEDFAEALQRRRCLLRPGDALVFARLTKAWGRSP